MNQAARSPDLPALWQNILRFFRRVNTLFYESKKRNEDYILLAKHPLYSGLFAGLSLLL